MKKRALIQFFGTGCCFLLLGAVHGWAVPDNGGSHPDAVPSASTPGPDQEAQSRRPWSALQQMEKAAFYAQQRNFILAERTYIQILESNSSEQEKQSALVKLAEVYYDRGVIAKAVDTLENFLRTYPDVDDGPEILFRLAQFYREMDLTEESIAMFYRVLNSIVITGESNLQKYLGMARLAQFEIARCHYDQAEYERAYLLFDRIDLLELNPVDRETVSYYRILSTVKSGHHEKELGLLRQFAQDFPESEFLPEIIYLEAEALYRLKRMKDSEEALMRLLENTGLPQDDTSGQSLFWRQQAGNRLANRFYDDGNFIVALRIYQGMVPLDSSPAWQLPVVYQIGLCFEKLSMHDRARESYQFISDQLKNLQEPAGDPALLNLGESASWRLEMISWRVDLGEKVDQLVVNMSSSQDNTQPET